MWRALLYYINLTSLLFIQSTLVSRMTGQKSLAQVVNSLCGVGVLTVPDGVVSVEEGVGAGVLGQEKLLSASTPVEENRTKPGESLLMCELIQDWYLDTLA